MISLGRGSIYGTHFNIRVVGGITGVVVFSYTLISEKPLFVLLYTLRTVTLIFEESTGGLNIAFANLEAERNRVANLSILLSK